MADGVHILDSEEMRLIVGGLKVLEHRPEYKTDQKKIGELLWLLMGARVTVEYSDGGYG
jgi:hypothetical protein